MAPKKSKQVTLDLGDFLSQHSQNEGPTNWGEDELELPSTFLTSAGGAAAGAPRTGGWSSGGGFTTEIAPIPDVPPFTARIGNVPYDITEEALGTFFETQNGLQIESMRLPQGVDGRVRAAYIDFASRDGLVKAVALSGQSVLGRNLSVQVAEQKGPRMGGGGFGGPEFDWTKRSGPADFGPPPPMGGERSDRFRRQDFGPEPDWSQRTGPLAPLDGPGPRRGPPRGPEPDMDWTARRGPLPPMSRPREPREPRAPREPEPEFDWTARRRPMPPARAPREPREPREHKEPQLDWSKRKGPIAGDHKPAPAPAAAATAPAAAAAPAAPRADSRKPRESRAQQLAHGFKALDLDDESGSEPDTAAAAPGAAADDKQVPPESLESIQKAQREAEKGQWSTA